MSLGRADECSGDDCSDSVADEVVVEDPSSDAEDDEVAADNGEDDQAAGTDPSGYGTRLKFTRRGEALSCVGNEKCYQWVAEYLVCYDASTGKSHDTTQPPTGAKHVLTCAYRGSAFQRWLQRYLRPDHGDRDH